MDRLLCIKEMELQLKPLYKYSGLDDFSDKCYQIFKEEIILTLPKYFQKIQEEEHFYLFS